MEVMKPQDRPIERGEQGVNVVFKDNDNRRELLATIEAQVKIVKGRGGKSRPVVDYKGERYRATRDVNGRLQIIVRPPSARNDATIDGVRPGPGLWLVNVERKRAYGKIKTVARNGIVTWVGPFKEEVETKAITIINGGYSYAPEPPAGFAVLTRDGWEVPPAPKPAAPPKRTPVPASVTSASFPDTWAKANTKRPAKRRRRKAKAHA